MSCCWKGALYCEKKAERGCHCKEHASTERQMSARLHHASAIPQALHHHAHCLAHTGHSPVAGKREVQRVWGTKWATARGREVKKGKAGAQSLMFHCPFLSRTPGFVQVTSLEASGYCRVEELPAPIRE